MRRLLRVPTGSPDVERDLHKLDYAITLVPSWIMRLKRPNRHCKADELSKRFSFTVILIRLANARAECPAIAIAGL